MNEPQTFCSHVSVSLIESHRSVTCRPIGGALLPPVTVESEVEDREEKKEKSTAELELASVTGG